MHLAFIRVLKQGTPPADLAAACCVAVRKLACNDELCAEVAEEGGVQLAIQVGPHIPLPEHLCTLCALCDRGDSCNWG